MKKLRKISKEYYLRQIVACWLVCYMLFMMPMQVAMADPNPAADAIPDGIIDSTGVNPPVVVSGHMVITQIASEAIINWENFDIGQAATVTFNQPSSTATVLIRVLDGNVTGIMGALMANGSVFIINPAGNIFGAGAMLNESQLIASSLNINDADFLDGLPYQFTGGELAGDVTNIAGDIRANRIALIGRKVTNEGYLEADEDVIMAAGDTVLISENSPVAVEVSMGTGSPSDFIIINEDGEGIEAKNIILAAGVIFLAAPIDAYAGAASDAVAMVNMEAGGDITIADEVRAEALGNGVDNATAAISIAAGGDVRVIANGDYAGIGARAYEGNANTANITIDAGGDSRVIAKGYGDVYMNVNAARGENNTANMKINAGGGVVVKAADESYADIEAETWEGFENNTANITIDAGGDSRVIAIEGGDVYMNVIAARGENNTADITIAADGGVEVIAEDESYADIYAETWEGFENNTANITIDAGGDSRVIAIEGGDVYMNVIAEDGEENNTANMKINAVGVVDVTAEHGSYVNIEAETYEGFENTANMEINAGGGVEVIAEDESYANIEAEADEGNDNTANITIDAGGDSEVIAIEDGRVHIDAIAEYGEENNTANVTIEADDDFMVIAEDESGVYIDAEAWDGFENKANMEIDAGGDVMVIAEDESGANIEAFVGAGEEGNNTTNMKINAGGVVEVTAGHYGYTDIDAEAYGGNDNTVNITIDADDDLKVMAIEDGGVRINARAMHGDNSTTNIEISAENVTASASGEDSVADILASAYDGYENNADVTICAPGEVTVTNEDAYRAQIKSWADDGELLSATTQAYAGEVIVSEDAYISAWAGEDQKDATDFRLTEDGEVVLEDGDAKLIIKEISFLDCSAAYPSIEKIWSPNHKWVEVEILGVIDSDGNPVAVTITGITQDEPVMDQGSGHTYPDGDGIGTSIAKVRAERSGQGNGRVYEISFETHDSAGGICGGGACKGTVQVCVPHDKSKKKEDGCADDGQIHDSTASALPPTPTPNPWPVPTPTPTIETVIDLDPDTLNLKSKGKWITCCIWLPEGYDVDDVDTTTIVLKKDGFEVGGEYGEFQTGKLMVKFPRSQVQDILEPGEVELTVTGELLDGTKFGGSDTIRVINKRAKK